jgi:hypothetical protein
MPNVLPYRVSWAQKGPEKGRESLFRGETRNNDSRTFSTRPFSFPTPLVCGF